MSQDTASAAQRVKVTVHMVVTLDGKISGAAIDLTKIVPYLTEYYRVDDKFKQVTQVCMCGRTTVEPLADLEDASNYPAAESSGDRSDFHADLATNPAPAGNHYFAMIDPHGRLGWKKNLFHHEGYAYYNGDRVVEVLVEDWVTDSFLAQLRKVNVPYVFAGKSELDFPLALEKLGKLLNTDSVVCHGGGTVNGMLLEQGLVDHLSMVLIPVVSGESDAVSVFQPFPGGKLSVKEFSLDSAEKGLEGCMWLQYSRKA